MVIFNGVSCLRDREAVVASSPAQALIILEPHFGQV
jgi:hypothetical protein